VTEWRLWVIRDRIDPVANPAMSAMPPKAEVIGGNSISHGAAR